jgi:hypothetical protein
MRLEHPIVYAVLLATLCIMSKVAWAGEWRTEPESFFRDEIGLTSEEIEAIGQGKAIVKMLPSPSPAEIFMFGAVFVKGKPEDYTKLAFDMDRLSQVPGYLGVGRMSEPPRLSDLEGFTLEPSDIRDLKRCEPGKCGVQLSAEMMKELQHTINTEGPEADAAVNERLQKMVLDLLTRYKAKGNRGLGVYRDKDEAFDVEAHHRSLISQAEALPIYLPRLSEYLIEYPEARLAGVDSFFFWEKVNFGLKPTLRLNHAILYRAQGPRARGEIIIAKQLYASHYIQAALDITACVPRTSESGEAGFYLISLKGSTQHGLTGFFRKIIRAIVVSRTRSSQEKILVSLKDLIEKRQP